MININSYNFNSFRNAAKPKNLNKLSIYYYNDTHGNTDEMTGIINSAKEFRAKSQAQNHASFILSAGDNPSGADPKKNDLILGIMQNMMGVDSSAIGNHEIDGGSVSFFEIIKNKNVPFVATNVVFADDNPLKNIVKKSIIKEQNGVKYGFVGTMPIDFKECTKTDVQKGIEVMDFDNTLKALQDEINNLKKQGVNRIILLSHVGYDIDKKLAQSLEGLDIIIGGHTHSVVDGIKEGENLLKSKTGEPVIITQAGENGKYHGLLDVEFDLEGIIKKVENKLVENTNLTKSPVVENLKTRYIGKSPAVATLNKVDKLPDNRRIEPCAWTCAMADAMREELDADIALINSANIRKVPKTGEVTELDITESAPMKNNLVKTKITQKQLVEAIQNAARQTMSNDDGTPGLLQGSGISYKIDKQGNLLEFYIVDKTGKKTAVDINNPSDKITYTTILDSFTIKPDGETPELAPKFEIHQYDFDKDKTMIDYLSKRKDKHNLEITDDHRIEITDTSQEKPQGSNNRKFLSLSAPKAS